MMIMILLKTMIEIGMMMLTVMVMIVVMMATEIMKKIAITDTILMIAMIMV